MKGSASTRASKYNQPRSDIFQAAAKTRNCCRPAVPPSVRGPDYGAVNQLHDPAFHEEDGVTYLLYDVGGEAWIAIARVDF
jgi:hypothetical protein